MYVYMYIVLWKNNYLLTQTRDQISPQLGRLPGQEEEAEEPHNYRIHSLFGYFRINLTDLCQIGGLRCPHRSGTQTD